MGESNWLGWGYTARQRHTLLVHEAQRLSPLVSQHWRPREQGWASIKPWAFQLWNQRQFRMDGPCSDCHCGADSALPVGEGVKLPCWGWLCLSLPPCQTWYPHLLSCPCGTSLWHCRAVRRRRCLLSLRTPRWQMLTNCPFPRHYSSGCSTRTQAGENGWQVTGLQNQPSAQLCAFWASLFGPIWFSETTYSY